MRIRRERPVGGSEIDSSRYGDVAVAVVLGLMAVPARLAARPTAGLFHDDAWVAVASIRGQPSRLLEIGSTQPGFLGLLMPLGHLSLDALGGPSLVAGILGPPVLFVFLRLLGYARSISTLLSVALVFAALHVAVSGRLKTYSLDLLLVVALTLVVRTLSGRRWTWRVAVAWVLGAGVASTISPFVLLAACVGGLYFVLEPSGDLLLRIGAVGTQAVASVLYVRSIQQNYNAAGLDQWWDARDAFIGFDTNPVSFGNQVLDHLGQVSTGYPAGPSWMTTLIVVGALAGLAHAVIRMRTVEARFLGLLVLVAVGLSAAGKLPVGSSQANGLRLSVWMIPAYALGLAHAMERVRRRLTAKGHLLIFDGACLGLALLIAIGGVASSPRYPRSGSEPATAFVESELGDDDTVLLLSSARFPFALYSHFEVTILNRRTALNGISLEFHDPRILGMRLPKNPTVDPEAVTAAVRCTRRVLVMTGIDARGVDPVRRAVPSLLQAGLTRVEDRHFGDATVSVWERAELKESAGWLRPPRRIGPRRITCRSAR